MHAIQDRLDVIKTSLADMTLLNYDYFIIIGNINSYRTATGILLADLLYGSDPSTNLISIVNSEVPTSKFFEILFDFGCSLDAIAKIVRFHNTTDLQHIGPSDILLHDNLQYKRNEKETESWKDDYLNFKGTKRTIKIPYNLRYEELLQLMNNPTRIGKVLVILNDHDENNNLTCTAIKDPRNCIALQKFFDNRQPYLASGRTQL